MPEDAYKLLQVDPEADPEVIQAAYRRLAQKFHPDVAPGPEAAARMAALNRAWAILRTPASRAAYDAERAQALAARERAARDETTRQYPRREPGGRRPSQGGAAPPESTVRRTPSESSRPGPAATAEPRRPETVSRDWTSGRSSVGTGYDPATMRTPEGHGAAGKPPGNPSGSVVGFGRYAGWSIGEIARHDVEYLEWLDRVPIGRQYRDEIDRLLRRAGRRRSGAAADTERRGLFRRR